KFAMAAWGYVREWLLKKARVLAVVGLGRNTFLPHTHQKASVLFAQKKEEGKTLMKEQRIFFAISERDGKDSKGQFRSRPGHESAASAWDRVDHDLEEIAGGFAEFCKAESLLVEE